MNIFKSKKSIIIISILLILTIVGILIVINEFQKIHKSDYVIFVDDNYDPFYNGNKLDIIISKPLTKVEHLEVIFDDIVNNYNDVSRVRIFDINYFIVFELQNNQLVINDIYDNIGTTDNPVAGSENTKKIKDLRVFLEKYNKKSK